MKVVKGNDSGKPKGNKLPKKATPLKPFEKEIHAADWYGKMLLDLILPYLDATEDEDSMLAVLEIGMLAWNMAVTKDLGIPGNDFMTLQLLKDLKLNKAERNIFMNIVKDKSLKYSVHTELIKDFDLGGPLNGVYQLDIVTNTVEHIMNDDYEDDSPYSETELHSSGRTDRAALIVTPSKAFYKLISEGGLPQYAESGPKASSIYLVEAYQNPDDIRAWLKEHFDSIFVSELNKWLHTKQKLWPKKRTFDLFSAFFEVKIHSIVIDMIERPITKDSL